MTLQEDVFIWAQQAFPKSTTQLIQDKLRQEQDEMHRAIDVLREFAQHSPFVSPERAEQQYQAIEEEAADVVIMMFQLAEVLEFDLLDEVRKKFEVNKARTWQCQPDGTYQHTTTRAASCHSTAMKESERR